MKIIQMMTFKKKIFILSIISLKKKPVHSSKKRCGTDHRAHSPELLMSYSAFKANKKYGDFLYAFSFQGKFKIISYQTENILENFVIRTSEPFQDFYSIPEILKHFPIILL